MLNINTNLSSLIVQSSLKSSTNGLNQAIERMTTGFKINHAKDNAANFSINTKLGSKLSSYQVAQDNVSMGLDMITTAMDSLDLITSHLSRMRDLAEQAANGTYGESSLKAIQAEINARTTEVNRIVSNTEYNNVTLLEGEREKMGDFIAKVDRLSEEEAIAQGYTIITTPDELQAMQDNLSGKYILMDDIDLRGYDWTAVGSYNTSFTGEFNGNGYVISNLKINTSAGYQGLFGGARNATIKNTGLENVDIVGNHFVGSFIGECFVTIISNCYATGSVEGGGLTGGIAGEVNGSSITDCYAKCDVKGGNAGGLVGQNWAAVVNCYAEGTVTGNGTSAIGGLAGNGGGSYSNSYANCMLYDGGKAGGFVGDFYGGGSITDCYWNTDNGLSDGIAAGMPPVSNFTGVSMIELEELIAKGDLPSIIPPIKYMPTNFQVGVNSSEASTITLNISFALTVPKIKLSTPEQARSSLIKIDELLKRVNTKQTEYGSAYNRLESALESIGVSIDNLTSTQSTIRDADIAEESSAYIRNQILQQASTTLLATANQTPAIALQLL